LLNHCKFKIKLISLLNMMSKRFLTLLGLSILCLALAPATAHREAVDDEEVPQTASGSASVNTADAKGGDGE
jgi:hypothetical protein